MKSETYIKALTGVLTTSLAVGAIVNAHFTNIHPRSRAKEPIYAYTNPFPTSLAAFRPQENPWQTTEAFNVQDSDILWSGSIPLEIQSEETRTNVELAAEAIDFTVLEPGETFSFNDHVGIRTEEKGYKAGLMYSAGQVVKGVGGGICIVSTLTYKGALESGLKIIERHPHSGPVSYADTGLDAAVSFGWADMAFKNNTGNRLLIRAEVEDDELKIAFFGKRQPGCSVEIEKADYEELPYKIFEKEDPSVMEGQVVVKQKARTGVAVTIVRIIKENGSIVSREIMNHDVMPPVNKIVLIPVKPKPEAAPAVEEEQKTETQKDQPEARPEPTLPASERTTSPAEE